MNIIRLTGEDSLASLVKRAFGIDADHPQAKQATAALTAANPQLTGKIAKLPEGMPVVVPPVEGLTQVATADPRLTLLLQQIDLTIKAASAAAASSTARPTASVEALASRTALAQTLIPAVTKTRSAKATAADKTAQKAASDALKQVQASLTAIKRNFGVT